MPEFYIYHGSFKITHKIPSDILSKRKNAVKFCQLQCFGLRVLLQFSLNQFRRYTLKIFDGQSSERKTDYRDDDKNKAEPPLYLLLALSHYD
jgi:hypothetical protein